MTTKANRSVKKSAPLHDRVTVFLTLAYVHTAADRPNDAAKVLTEAENQFKDTPERVRSVGRLQWRLSVSLCICVSVYLCVCVSLCPSSLF